VRKRRRRVQLQKEEDLFKPGAMNEADPEEERGAEEVEAGKNVCLLHILLHIY
jgi:hypothetical protein